MIIGKPPKPGRIPCLIGGCGRTDAQAKHEGHTQGRFILTINDGPEARKLYAGFKIERRKLHYGVSGGAVKASEIIVRGGGR